MRWGWAIALTLASSVAVDVAGYAYIEGGAYSGDGIVNKGAIDVTGSASDLQIDSTTFTNSGTIDVADGGTAYIESGTITNDGIIRLGGGTLTSTASGASLTDAAGSTLEGFGTVSATTFDNSGAIEVSGGTLTLTDGFSADAGSTISISRGDSLTLTGTDALSSATISGAGPLDATGKTTVSGLTIGGTTTFSDSRSLSQSGGSVTLGDASGDAAKLTIASSGFWNIVDDRGIARGTSTSSAIINHGLLEKGGTGTSVITPKVTNDGTVAVYSGTLELEGAVTETGTHIGTDSILGAATLEFDAGVSTAAKLGDQYVLFTGGGTLDLLKPTSFYGEISNFGSGDSVDLKGSWAFSSLSETGAMTTLTLASGSTTHGFEFLGDYAQSDFSIVSGTTTKITYT